jgi:hypothetical protein
MSAGTLQEDLTPVPCITCGHVPHLIPIWVRVEKKNYLVVRCNCSKQTGHVQDSVSAIRHWNQMNQRQRRPIKTAEDWEQILIMATQDFYNENPLPDREEFLSHWLFNYFEEK